jgi:hypothetical protein
VRNGGTFVGGARADRVDGVPVRGESRAERVTRLLPARWIDVSVDAATAHEAVRAAMARRRYTPIGEVVNGVNYYRHGTLLSEFVSDVVGFSLITWLTGRPTGYAKFAGWTEPAPGGTRVNVSLVTGYAHAAWFRLTVDDLINGFGAAGTLLGTSDPFSGIDLPDGSPGQPLAHRRRRARS